MYHSKDARIPERLSDVSQKRREAKRQTRASHFIRGPILIEWVRQAAALPGKALVVGLAIYFKAGMGKPDEPVPVSTQLLVRFGVPRRTGHRAIDALESASLVEVDRHRGRAPRVKILAAPEEPQP